jgi:hypothetical protein
MKALILSVLLLPACPIANSDTKKSDDSATSSGSSTQNSGRVHDENRAAPHVASTGGGEVMFAATRDNLPECNLSIEARLYYVEEETEFLVCSASSWIAVDVRGEKGERGSSGEKGELGERGQQGERGARGLPGLSGGIEEELYREPSLFATVIVAGRIVSRQTDSYLRADGTLAKTCHSDSWVETTANGVLSYEANHGDQSCSKEHRTSLFCLGNSYHKDGRCEQLCNTEDPSVCSRQVCEESGMLWRGDLCRGYLYCGQGPFTTKVIDCELGYPSDANLLSLRNSYTTYYHGYTSLSKKDGLKNRHTFKLSEGDNSVLVSILRNLADSIHYWETLLVDSFGGGVTIGDGQPLTSSTATLNIVVPEKAVEMAITTAHNFRRWDTFEEEYIDATEWMPVNETYLISFVRDWRGWSPQVNLKFRDREGNESMIYRAEAEWYSLSIAPLFIAESEIVSNLVYDSSTQKVYFSDYSSIKAFDIGDNHQDLVFTSQSYIGRGMQFVDGSLWHYADRYIHKLSDLDSQEIVDLSIHPMKRENGQLVEDYDISISAFTFVNDDIYFTSRHKRGIYKLAPNDYLVTTVLSAEDSDWSDTDLDAHRPISSFVKDNENYLALATGFGEIEIRGLDGLLIHSTSFDCNCNNPIRIDSQNRLYILGRDTLTRFSNDLLWREEFVISDEYAYGDNPFALRETADGIDVIFAGWTNAVYWTTLPL